MQKCCLILSAGGAETKRQQTQYYENRDSGCGRDGEPSGENAQWQRPRHYHHRRRPEVAFRRGEPCRRDFGRGRFDDLRCAPQGAGAQVRPVHRREPRGERQCRGGDAGQEARGQKSHRPHRQQRIPGTHA